MAQHRRVQRARDLLDDWKKSQRRVLKTKQDYDDMTAWGGVRASRRKTGTRANNKLAPALARAQIGVARHPHQRVVSDLQARRRRRGCRPFGVKPRHGRQERQTARFSTSRTGRLHHRADGRRPAVPDGMVRLLHDRARGVRHRRNALQAGVGGGGGTRRSVRGREARAGHRYGAGDGAGCDLENHT